MKLLKILALSVLALGMAGCAAIDTVSRSSPLDLPQTQAQTTAPLVMRNYDVQSVRVMVPTELSISEANSYFPIADIVWRGDAPGDRRAQIADIFQTAIAAGTAQLTGKQAVIVDVTLTRFHSLTERTRYAVGGMHSIRFDLTVRDALTGTIIEGPQAISTELAAFGGRAAIEADQRGQTQKVRVTNHLTQVFETLLSGPVGAFQVPPRRPAQIPAGNS